MQRSMDINSKNIFNNNQVTLPCITLCGTIFLIIGLLPLLPYSFTQILRPIFIVSCFVSTRSLFYKMGIAAKMQIIYIFYFGIVLFCYDLTIDGIVDYISIVLFGIFFVLVAQRVWSKREILLIMNIMILAGVFLAIVLLNDNPSLQKMENEFALFVFDSLKNRNTMAFSLVPAALCSSIMLFHNPKTFKTLYGPFYIAAMLLCTYVIIATGARSASISVLAGIFLIGLDWTRKGRSSKSKLKKTIFFVLLVVAGFLLIFRITENTGSARIFKDLDDINGRESLWDFAWKLIDEKPVWGGGFDYWRNMNGDHLGTHNTYLTILVISGYAGAAMLTLFLGSICLELLTVRSLVPFAFIVELLCHTYSESSMDYYAYFPLTFAFILYSYLKHENRNLSTLFIN